MSRASSSKIVLSIVSQASSSKIYNYDVFLSFCGQDTRRNIVSHLYSALQQRGIHTFKDDERLETGKPISYELLKAIEEARFAIVIFSKSYASSRWCLEELAHIIKCKNKLEQIVIPVFYDVSPSDVRHQNPPFANSFSQHEKKYKDDIEKVQRWRDAFVQAGNISGYHLPNFKDEADCINEIVDDIFPKLLQIISLSPLQENLVDMESHVEKVISLLAMDSNDVRSIGIWGMGGIGKTTIANVVHQRCRRRFEADCFLDDVGKFYEENELPSLQQKIIYNLLGETMTITSVHVGKSILQNMLRRKKVLFILDDVNHRNQLKSLVGGPECFRMGSRIILVARDKHLLISHVGDNIYGVQLLSEDNALELFSWHAFKEKSPKEDFMELSRQVVKHVGGLPLAVEVLGSSLYGRDKEYWRHRIGELKRIPEKDILGRLKLSFDGLGRFEKELFLDIVFLDNAGLTGWYDSHICVELVLGDPSRGFLIDHLIEKSLLSIDIDNRIVMHNMIREMGEHVIREEYANNRIWLLEEVCDLFKGKLITEKVESLFIPEESFAGDYQFVNYSNIFKRMQSLKILKIGHVGNISSLLFPCFKNTITYLPSSLRFIEWWMCPLTSLPESFEPSQLVVLSLPLNILVELWPISKKLSNLKHLDLKFSHKLTKTPNFGDMPNLERLNLCECVNLEEVHPSLGHCRMLTFLNLWGCRKLKKLPKFVRMESLETLNLDGCTSLQEFPEICGDMHRLSNLCVESPWIRSLPSSLNDLGCLELFGCEVLESIPNTYQNLRCLSVSGCNKFATLPNNLFNSQKLVNLNIDRCSELVELPISLRVQNKLSSLEIEKCENLKKLPSSIKMESLKELKISNCPKLDTFPEIKGDMHRLNKLALNSTGIREVPALIWQLRGLKYLYLEGYEDLVNLPDSLCNLMNLQHLSLKGNKKLEKLPENIGDLQELLELDASDTAISQPPPSITKLGKLCKLSFSHDKQQCQHSSSFTLHQVSGLSSLQKLDLSNCNILEGLPEDLGSLHFLKELILLGSDISCLPKSINKLLRLCHLNVQFCRNLDKLPGELPPNLTDLCADYHLALQSIRDLVIFCLELRSLSISDYGAVSSEQVNEFLQHFRRTCIKCDFNQRNHFVISFPAVKILELFDYRFINPKKISIDLNPSWYTNKFMGFWISCGPTTMGVNLEAILLCKFDPERKYSLKNYIPAYSRSEDPSICCIYIPFERLWRYASGNKEGKNPNDYYKLELSQVHLEIEIGIVFLGICLEYENEAITYIPSVL